MAWQHRGARLTDDAAKAWDRLCTDHGVSFTTLIQALGELHADPGAPDWVPERAVKRARQLDRARHSRRR